MAKDTDENKNDLDNNSENEENLEEIESQDETNLPTNCNFVSVRL